MTVRVLWDEHGRRDQSFEVVQYLTDPAKLDLALHRAAARRRPAAGRAGQRRGGTGTRGGGIGLGGLRR